MRDNDAIADILLSFFRDGNDEDDGADEFFCDFLDLDEDAGLLRSYTLMPSSERIFISIVCLTDFIFTLQYCA